MKILTTAPVHAEFVYFCDSCGYEIIDSDAMCETMGVTFGWPHWADTEKLLFCGDSCLISFLQIGIVKFGGYQAKLGKQKREVHFLAKKEKV